MASGFQIDWTREERTGIAEAMLCANKSPAQVAEGLRLAVSSNRRMLLTRLPHETYTTIPDSIRGGLDYDGFSETAFLGSPKALDRTGICVVAAGTSDLRVAAEAKRTLAFNGFDAPVFADVGVAGLWRLMDCLDEIRSFAVAIAVAGMEGALFSVLGGLVSAPVIAVPTSVGYGVGANGATALNAALASCAPGVLVTNIDNGFGAACAAIKIINAASTR